VISFEIATPIGDFICSRTSNADLFWATVGGMGLTGIIKSAKINMLKIETSLIKASTFKEKNLDLTIERMYEVDKENDYSVAWVDTLAKNKNLGRSIVSVGNHASRSDVTNANFKKPLEHGFEQKLKVPKWVPHGLLNRESVRIFNQLYYHRQFRKKSEDLKSLSSFFYPLDFLMNWNNFYGNYGFLQYQIVVPDKSVHVVKEIIRTFSELNCPIFLAVLKRMGNKNKGMLSFPIEGWTLALDISTKFPNLEGILDSMDEKVIAANGKVYLAKDSRMSATSFKLMYPEVENFRNIKQKFDPNNQIQSDLSRRLMI
jgi:decaprenylphospho-beta-D-ribofuranose 2-oxidase